MKYILVLIYVTSRGVGMVDVPGEYEYKSKCLMAGMEVQLKDDKIEYVCVVAP